MAKAMPRKLIQVQGEFARRTPLLMMIPAMAMMMMMIRFFLQLSMFGFRYAHYAI